MADVNYDFVLDPVDVPHVETRYRRIVTPQPAPGAVEVLQRLRRHEPMSMSPELPVLWTRASAFQVEDGFGNRWLDFTSGIFVANVGHGHPRVRDAIVEMTDRPLLHAYMFPTEVRARLVERLVRMTEPSLDAVLLLTTGAEANEALIKMARTHGLRTADDKLGIVSLTFGFHGKTMGAQTAGGRAGQKRWIGRLDPNFHLLPVPYAPLCPFHDADEPCGARCFELGMAGLADSGVDLETIAAFLVEPYQGWAAALLPADYVQAMRAWADEHRALVCFDEVQSGIGRTGKLLAYEHFGVEADLVTCGKGISSSLPLAAVLGRRELLDVDDSLNSTHGGNPLCCAAALATLEVIEEENLVEAAATVGERLGMRLRAAADRLGETVGRVEGRGMVWALHLVDPDTGELDGMLGDMAIERAMRKGLLLVRTGTGTIKVGPALGIPEDAAFEGADVIEQSVAEAVAERAVALR
jgi:4-aminobutyrate aminotransferase/(S)-3-amino-2-methylpropionate transaminase